MRIFGTIMGSLMPQMGSLIPQRYTILSLLYWALPLVLFVAQVVFTLSSTSQIRAEEMANGIRNPFWLVGRTVYDGISTNFGWDGTLLLIYELFGFDIFGGKYYRLALHLISLFCLAALLRRFLGEKKAIVPLLTIGLSPTFIFFSSLQSQYGIDLEYLPIVLFFLLSDLSYLRYLGWALAMVAWLSYPTFVFYLPALFFLGVLPLRTPTRRTPKASVRSVGAPRSVSPIRKNILTELVLALFFFLLPLVLGFLWIENREILIHDPQTGTGIFRGGGGEFLKGNVDFALGNLFTDLFSKGTSYNFDLASAEFSLIFPAATLAVVFVLSFAAARRNRRLKPVVIISWLVLLFNLAVFISFSDNTGVPGARRATGMLAAFYGLFIISWHHILITKRIKHLSRLAILGILLLLPLHHMIVYPQNLNGIGRESRFRETYWFTESRTGVYEIFKSAISNLEKEDLYLSCSKDPGVTCRYSDFYAALAGACRWNNLRCHTIYGEDPATGHFIPLRRELWNSGYLAH